MSLVIWEPRRYVSGFAKDSNNQPINGAVEAAPFNHDTRVAEIVNFNGYKKTYFCDTGEMEAEFYAGQIEPSSIKRGYIADLDGDHFVIDGISWKLGESGYTCSITGKDLGCYLDALTVRGVFIGSTYTDFAGVDATFSDYTKIDSRVIKGFLSEFMGSDARSTMSRYYPQAGWFRDKDREPSGGFVQFDFKDSANLTREFGSSSVTQVMSFGATLRALLAYGGFGYRWKLEWNKEKGLYEIAIVVYDEAFSECTFKTSGRGISGFEYEENDRAAVTAVYAHGKSNVLQNPLIGAYDVLALSRDYEVYDATIEGEYEFSWQRYETNGAKNYAELIAQYKEEALDVGTAGKEQNADKTKYINWLETQTGSTFKEPEKTASFKYDNSGALKFGVHFGLGSNVTLIDEFLGVELTQRLVGVKQEYEGGRVDSFELEFNNKRITQNDAIKRKLSIFNKRK